MKKKTNTAKVKKAPEKSIYRQAGEVVGSIGAHIVQAKDSIVGFVDDEVTTVKKMAKKISRKIKKQPAKKQRKKTTKKALKAFKKRAVKKS